MKQRNFLFLQGPCAPFFTTLADRLKILGHGVYRINFCAGDAFYWGKRPAFHYRDKSENINNFLTDIYQKNDITDQILFGDCRPIHRQAVLQAKQHGIKNHIFEEGYFRPHWVTLEREGTNAYSLLPRDKRWFLEAAKKIPQTVDPTSFRSSFTIRAMHDIFYHAAGAFNAFRFPGYQTHALTSAPVEYLGYIKRFSILKLVRAKEENQLRQLIDSGQSFFMLPLQLNGDAQIRNHSSFADMGEVIEHVLASFAKHAPQNVLLVIKNHPLDMGLMNYDQIIKNCERRFDLKGRILYFEEGDLGTLLSHTKGVITVNSTTGFVALEAGVPTISLSTPVYDLPGLTFEEQLDDFWTTPMPPDLKFFECFRRVVLYSTQINGGFYTKQGIDLAVKNASDILLMEKSRLEELL